MSRTSATIRRLSRHMWWKLASLVVAALLWLIIEGSPELVTMQTVPILYRNLASGLVLSSDAPGTARTELSGSSVKLTMAALSQVFVALDLSDIQGPDERTYTIASSNVTLPVGISFLRVIPSQVRVVVDRVAVKSVPVKVRIVGTPPAGYTLVGQEVSPNTLRIAGPEAHVSRIEFAETDPIDVRSMTQTTETKVNSFMPDERVRFESQSAVTVILTLERTETR